MTGTLLWVGLWLSVTAGLRTVRDHEGASSHSTPFLTLSSLLIIAGFSSAQLIGFPALLPLLMRDGLVGVSQPWRLITSIVVQDGGWAGAVFNLTGLLVTGWVAERLLGRAHWLAVALLGVLAAQFVALSWQPLGGGNSILDFALAGAVCAASVSGGSKRPGRLPAMGAFASFALQLFMRDIHGVAATTGALVEFVLELWGRGRGTPPTKRIEPTP